MSGTESMTPQPAGDSSAGRTGDREDRDPLATAAPSSSRPRLPVSPAFGPRAVRPGERAGGMAGTWSCQGHPSRMACRGACSYC